MRTRRSKTPAATARRFERRARWAGELATPGDRRAAWFSLMLVDHGFLRLVHSNRFKVTDNLWRSSQPAPADIRFAKRAGIRTVISLRKETFGGDPLEREACAKAGLHFERIIMRSREAPAPAMLREAIARFPLLPRPVLFHCKSGADRAGLATALYLIIVEGASAATAAEALSLRYGHFSRGKTGILDAFIGAYATTGEAAGLSFSEWVETVYDPEALLAGFRTSRTADRFLDAIGRE
ncbi:tyrosine-protein phosphatase [Acuticoccus sp. MNP-M23]|uniref:phosphatase domain-containing protein n=1 Tax=Acuticoccus sp. MNP-M23 TaxID=3072793 RepID=UPI002814D86A|nr:tyrosine-protein phosphatase [Acuticoccus sp. MNP-M23]WMS41619.1 tyrosine-protein phosphatase [Acuticoccus sp. MNP-M23]